jgi:hypothetical protein
MRTKRIKAVSRLLEHSDEATALRYYVRDAFSDKELFGEVNDTASEIVRLQLRHDAESDKYLQGGCLYGRLAFRPKWFTNADTGRRPRP